MEENVCVAMNNDLIIEMKPEIDWETEKFTEVSGIAYNKNDMENAIIFRSGGGGGDGVTMTIVNVSLNDQERMILDKNYNEIKAVLEAGNLAETFFDNEIGDYNYNLINAYGSFDDEGTTIYYVKNINGEIFVSDSPTGVLTFE